MRPTLLCVPNVSEGRDSDLIAALARVIESVPEVKLFDRSFDPDHHRSVFAFLGEPRAVAAAARALAAAAWERIDMRRHEGAHPRIGAVDVVPFVPVRNVSLEEASDVARAFGRWAGEAGVPVYYYEASASRPERRELPNLRRGGYEGLAGRFEDPSWAPDEGPSRVSPRSGALVTGARRPLVAFNVNLRSRDLGLARDIARRVRESSGGLPAVRAIGVALARRGLVQVSMNLTDIERTPLSAALEAVRNAAAGSGVEVEGTELIGAVPLSVMEDVARLGIGARGFAAAQVIEGHLGE